MVKDTKFRLIRYSILGFCFGGIWWNRPIEGVAMFSLENIVFIAYVMVFSYLLAKWCWR